VARQLGAVAARNLQRALDVVERGLGNRADELAAVGMTNLDDAVAGDFLACDAQRFANRVARTLSMRWRWRTSLGS
jgi:hypothetical protein